MSPKISCFFILVTSVLAPSFAASAAEPPAPAGAPTTRPFHIPEGFRTVDTAISAQLRPTRGAVQAAYLGAALAPDDSGRLVIQSIAPRSPATVAELKPGDILVSAGDQKFTRPEGFEEWLLQHAPGQKLSLTVLRDGKTVDLSATLAPASRPMKLSDRRAIMGVRMHDATDGEGAAIDEITPNLPADKAGIHAGDIIVECESVPIVTRQSLSDNLFGRNPGDSVRLMVKRDGKLDEFHVTLGADPNPLANTATGDRPSMFKKSVYHLAVIGVEFPDVQHSPKIATRDWEQSLFSTGAYTTTNATSQPVHGSLNDYYLEDSAAAFHVEGKFLEWVQVAKKRIEYSRGTGDPEKMLPEVLRLLLKHQGPAALRPYDGIAFIYAGQRIPTTRGGLFWPHKGNLIFDAKRWSYLIVPEGGSKMTDISLFCHEFGHMLGLPDLYARPENPGSEGVGLWCIMSNQLPNGRPQHMCAWCKEQLGWLKPTIIDPAVPQKLALAPVEGSSKECFKVLVRSDGSEYFLLENRHHIGFDTHLAGEGLLIWRVVAGRPFLVASHGIEGPAGPRSYLEDVPFPSISNSAFTPHTMPSSRSLVGGGQPVYITDIERHDDGVITFSIGTSYY
jgi:M6 family metalloprotease-like protein